MFAMTAIVKGMIWAAAVEPVMQMLGLGSIFAVYNIATKPETYDGFFIRSEKASKKKKDKDENEGADGYIKVPKEPIDPKENKRLYEATIKDLEIDLENSQKAHDHRDTLASTKKILQDNIDFCKKKL